MKSIIEALRLKVEENPQAVAISDSRKILSRGCECVFSGHNKRRLAALLGVMKRRRFIVAVVLLLLAGMACGACSSGDHMYKPRRSHCDCPTF